MKADRPRGVTAIAVLFLLAAAYLLVVGLLMLASPGLISMAAGADLLAGLEVAGPYMFLLMAAVGTTIAVGLLHLRNWARRVAALVALLASCFFCQSFRALLSAFGCRSWPGAAWE